VELKRPAFIVGVVLIVVALLLEIGATGLVSGAKSVADKQVTEGKAQAAAQVCPPDKTNCLPADAPGETRSLAEDRGKPPGLGIPYLALIDGVLVFTIGLMALALFVPGRVGGRVQGVVTLVFSIVLILASLLLTILAFVQLILMVTLLFAFPFGTIAYLAGWGFFATAAAKVVLGLIMLLKLGFVVCLVLAQPRFLQNKGLVLLVLTSLIATIIVSFLQGLVPSILVSITDALAAVIVGIIAIIWCIVLLIGSIPAIVRAVTSGHPLAGNE
jgi:hypothetical protein